MMCSMPLRAACLLSVLLAAAGSVNALQSARSDARSALQERLQAKFSELHKAASFPGGTAGFVLADGSTFGIAVGVSDRTAQTPMTTSDRLLLGSVGKTYVSAVALQMIAEKKFALTDTLDKFFANEPWFSRIANGPKITVRHLMTHSSGLTSRPRPPLDTRHSRSQNSGKR